MKRWTPNRAWFAGPDAVDHCYELDLRIDPPASIDRLWVAFRELVADLWADPGDRLDDPDAVDVGGAAVRHDGDHIAIVSGGEDAMDSLEYVADLLLCAARRFRLDVHTHWTEQPRTAA